MKAYPTPFTCPIIIKVDHIGLDAIQEAKSKTVCYRTQRSPEIDEDFFGYSLAPFGRVYASLSANLLSVG